MTSPFRIRRLLAATLAMALAALVPVRQAGAELADLANVPLANSPSDAVLPNLMYVLDDSGSMAWNYMPDHIQTMSGGSPRDVYNCKRCTSTSCGGPGGPAFSSSTSAMCADGSGLLFGEAPFYANEFNRIWYNPNITYAPAVDFDGTSRGNSTPVNASDDAYLGTAKTNLLNAFREYIYCTTSSPTGADKTNTAKCRKNGIHNVTPFAGTTNYFLYWGNSGNNVGLPNTTFRYPIEDSTSNAHYYVLTPHEYCSDANLTTCVLANAAGTAAGTVTTPLSTYEAPVRWCKTAAQATSTAVVSGPSATNPNCRKKFDRNTYKYARYGRFKRVDIVPSVTTYAKGPKSVRTDCASATSCTYDEEIQNFANWWTYYRTRMALMKTATGRAFLPIDDRFRIGFITINPNNPVTTDKFQPVARFDSTQRKAWYDKVYVQNTNGSTPNRTALHRVGRYYMGLTDGINTDMKPDPLEYSCQQNFALLTTDGYWNDSFSAIGNVDNKDSGYTTRAFGAYDGALTGASSTLADVAAYYYGTDLRTTGPFAENNVPTSIGKDMNPTQHMVTFTLGLGLEGFMDYQSDYQTSKTGDFAKIVAGGSGCSWTGGTCNWPVPAANEPSTLDDLWHAAVNGRGKYFSASDPNALTQGLQNALAALNVQTAAAAASATSSPNITETDNFIYSSTFRTAKWDGEIVAQRIDTVSGSVLPAIVWSAQALLDGKTSGSSDTRTIFTIDESAGGKKKDFIYSALSSAASGGIAPERDYFDNKCTAFSQCALLTSDQKDIANKGENLVGYLRGWRQHETYAAPETNPPFRTREHILGDPVNATPAFMKAPQYGFADVVTPTYADYKTANKTRTATLFIAANDGMLHALNGDTGQEMWAYVPRIVMPKLHRLATENWTVTHEYSVDGSPQLMDAYISGAWRTVLVAGLNGGGRGFYALDVTDPASPTVLWEICQDSTLCKINDADIGFTHGNPVITKRASDGKWVALLSSGLNNVSPGDGKGYLYVVDLASGAILSKVSTGEGTAATPSGLNHLAAYADNFYLNNTAKYVYGVDLYGNVWKFDLTSGSPTVLKLAELKDASGKPQSITSRPDLGNIKGYPVVFVGTGRYLGTDDLVDPATLVPPNQWAYQQSLYAIKDQGVAYGNFRTKANVVQQTLITNGVSRSTSNLPVDWTIKDGWYIDFNPGGESPGERVNIDVQLVQGTLIVVTNVPNNNACTVGGDSWIYQFSYETGAYVPSAALQVAGEKFTGKITVGVVVVRLPSGVFKGIATGATGEKSTFAVNIGGAGGAARRVSWRELIQR